MGPTWTANSGAALDDMNGTWNDLFSGVARANLMIGVIEQEMNGSPGLIFMESVAQANGGAVTVGSGTGYFSLNLISAGVVRRATCTDISPGMLHTLEDNALRLGLAASRVFGGRILVERGHLAHVQPPARGARTAR